MTNYTPKPRWVHLLIFIGHGLSCAAMFGAWLWIVGALS